MLLVIGEDSPFVDCLCDTLVHREVAHRRIQALEAVAERGDLFQAAFDTRAGALVVVERTAHLGAGAPAPDDALIDAALGATSAPGVKLLVIVTARVDDDPALRRVRQRGVPYVVLRPAPLFALLPRGVRAGLRDRSVLIPAELAAAIEGSIPVTALAEAVLGALEGSFPQGRVVDVAASPETSLEALLARAGAKPKAAGGLRSRVGRWFGQAVARLDGGAVRIDGIGDDAGAAPDPSAVLAAIAA